MDAAEIETLFAVLPRALERLPWGEDGHSFRVRTDTGDYHLKCIAAPVGAFSLDLVRQLRESGAFRHVPRRLPARDGALQAQSADGFAVLSEWIEGPPMNPLGVFPRCNAAFARGPWWPMSIHTAHARHCRLCCGFHWRRISSKSSLRYSSGSNGLSSLDRS